MISKEMERNIKENGGIREAFNEARQQKALYGEENVFDLSIGNPSAPAPEKVIKVLKELSEKKNLDHQYMCESGYEEVRSKIAGWLNQKYKTSYGINNIIMTNGVAGGLNMVLRALLNPGDEVVIFKPYYPAYKGFAENWQGKIIEVEPREDFQPDFDDLEGKLTERTKVVIVNSPHNPTGVIYTKETARKLSEILECKQKEYGHAICLLSDEHYRLNLDPFKSSIERAWGYMLKLNLFDEGAEDINIDDHINTELYKAALDECIDKYHDENPDFYDTMLNTYNEYDK